VSGSVKTSGVCRYRGAGMITQLSAWLHAARACIRLHRTVGLPTSLLALLVLASCEAGLQTEAPTSAIAPADLRAIDGDTVSWRGERVRLVGFDTPEIFSPQCASEAQKGQAAKRMLAGMIANARSADLAIRPERHRYGRILAVLFLDETNVGPRLMAAGLARRYEGGRRQSWCGA
jgi:micrococcal nuclease